jgi:hypothetical protein
VRRKQEIGSTAGTNDPDNCAKDHHVTLPSLGGDKKSSYAAVMCTNGGDALHYPGYGNLKNFPSTNGAVVSIRSYYPQPSDICHVDSLKSLLSIHSIQSQPAQTSQTMCQLAHQRPPAYEEYNHGEEWNPISIESVADDPPNPLTFNDLNILFALGHHSDMTGGNSDTRLASHDDVNDNQSD